jgi:hypothetical protein
MDTTGLWTIAIQASLIGFGLFLLTAIIGNLILRQPKKNNVRTLKRRLRKAA